jgi:hypothetical protein
MCFQRLQRFNRAELTLVNETLSERVQKVDAVAKRRFLSGSSLRRKGRINSRYGLFTAPRSKQKSLVLRLAPLFAHALIESSL